MNAPPPSAPSRLRILALRALPWLLVLPGLHPLLHALSPLWGGWCP